jgi:ribose transport system substrate-binding protein
MHAVERLGELGRAMVSGQWSWLSAVILVFLAGCGEQADPGPTVVSKGDSSGASIGKPRIALVMKSLANEFFSTMARGAEDYAAASGGALELVVNGIQDETDLSGQVSLVEQMIAQQVSAIVIAPADSQALIPVLQRAVEAGIVVINIDNRLDAGVLQSAGLTIPFVGPDNRSGARKVGDYLASKLPKAAEVAVLEGIETSFNGQQRKLGFEAAMETAGLRVVASQSAQWEMSQANQATAAILTAHPDVKGILACNDSMALGALAAVRAAGRTDVMIVGFDNIMAVQQAIRENQILATADQHGDQLAVYGIEYALQALRGGEGIIEDRETAVDLITATELSALEKQEKP